MAVGDAHERRRATVLWVGIGVLLLAAFVAGLGAVQRAYYSPGGFVEAYVRSIAAHDVSSALAMPGAGSTSRELRSAGLPVAASRELLRSDVLPALTDVTVASDVAVPGGVHRVTVRARADDRPVSATFTVRPYGAALGILPMWEFASSPLGVARVTVAHTSDFTIGGHTVHPRAASPDQPAGAFSVSADYVVLPLATLVLDHRSRYLDARPASVTGAPGRVTEATVDAQPTPAFTGEVQKQVDAFLDRCAQQQVLQPAGCPFGVEIDDRVQGAPHWSMAAYPAMELRAGDTAWQTDDAVGAAHLDVTVQSLFDGTVTRRETDEPFSMRLSSVVIRSDGSLGIVVAQ
jgi:hypothetical protein